MKIKSFSTEQYAGIRDVKVDFSEGINVVLGNNESGKSTMIYALYTAFTQPTKLSARSKSDKAFIGYAFPTDGRQTVDATVCVEADDEYKIERIWDISPKQEDARISLKGKNSGVVRGTQAEERLSEICGFGTGVYSNVVFGRQSCEDEMLDWCAKFFSGVSDDEIDEVKQKISEAFSAVGGVSQDKFRELIESKISEMERNWDFTRNRAGGNKRNGILAQAYTELKESEEELACVVEAETEINSGTKRISQIRQRLSELSLEENKLKAKQDDIRAKSNLAALISSVNAELASASAAAERWPRAVRYCNAAEKLRAALAESEKRAEKSALMIQLEKAEKASGEIQRLSDIAEKYPDIKEDARRARDLFGTISRADAALSAAKLSADIEIFEGYSASVSSAAGSKTVTGAESVEAEGFVGIEIPGVAAIRVAPQELDVDGLISRREKAAEELSGILARYGAADVESLAALAEENDAANRELELEKRGLMQLLGGKTIDELRAQAGEIDVDESVDVPETLNADISELLKESGARSLDALIGSAEKTISDCRAAYSDEKALSEKISELEAKKAGYSEQMSSFSGGEIIGEAEFEKRLSEIEETRARLERETDEINRMIGALEEKSDKDISQLNKTIQLRRERFEREKEKYAAYKRIQRDFEEIAAETERGFDGFYQRFGEYLGIISDEKIKFESGEGLKLQSGGNTINDKLLSEGTKKTALLAFRLAVLDFYYPDGGGFIVLDDDLVDMDPNRRECAAKLLEQFSKRNQVIITTCDPAIANLLGGNLIRLS